MSTSPYSSHFLLLCFALLGCTSACSEDSPGPGGSGLVSRVAVQPGTVTLEPSETSHLIATAYDADDRPLSGQSITWSTDNPSVASVSESGLVMAIQPGSAVVSATAGGVRGSSAVTVTPVPPTGQNVAVWPGVTYQTIVGWEGTAQIGHIECDQTAYAIYKNQLLDRLVNELGLTRVRIETRSGFENPTDWFTRYITGEIDRPTWRAQWYQAVNDNADPQSANAAGYHFSWLDYDIDHVVTPLRARMAARGERLYINLTYVDFANSAFEHAANPLEYGEYMLVLFQHLQQKYGWVPDAIEIILEPDNTQAWRAGQIAAAIVAAGDRLKAAGFEPDFIAPATTNASNAVSWFDEMVKTPRVLEYLTDLSYHRYSGVSTATIEAIGARAAQYGIRSAMLEHIGSGYVDLHMDLSLGRNSTWQQFAMGGCAPGDPGGRYYLIDASVPTNPKVTLASRTHLLRLYFQYIRPGAVRLGAASGDGRFDPLAFRNANGKFVVVVRTTAAGTFRVQGLPGGTYGLRYGTASVNGADLPDVTIPAGGEVPVSMPDAGVVTIYQR